MRQTIDIWGGAMETTELTPGLYQGMSMADYRALPYLNSSALKWILYSPLHCRAAMDGKLDRHTDAMRLGGAFHTCLLEPHIWDDYPVCTTCCAMTKGSKTVQSRRCQHSGKHRVVVDGETNWYCGTHVKPFTTFIDTPQEFCSEEEHDICEGMRKSVFNHGVGDILHQRGGHEVVIVWDEVVQWTEQTKKPQPETQFDDLRDDADQWEYTSRRVVIRCKGRVDKLITVGHPITLDAKSCMLGKANPYHCRKAIAEYGYIFQGSMYRAGVHNLSNQLADDEVESRHDLPIDLETDLIWLFVEKSAPFDVCVIQADAMDIDIGGREYAAALLKFAKCTLSGEWPGANPETVMPALPKFRREQGERNEF